MRLWSISAFFPEVKPAHLAQQSCVVPASGIEVAARRGLECLLDLEGIKGKHINIVKLSIVAAGKDAPAPARTRSRSAGA